MSHIACKNTKLQISKTLTRFNSAPSLDLDGFVSSVQQLCKLYNLLGLVLSLKSTTVVVITIINKITAVNSSKPHRGTNMLSFSVNQYRYFPV